MIFNLRFELTTHDLAVGIAVKATRTRDPRDREATAEWIRGLSKTEIRELAKERVQVNGEDTENWGEFDGDFYDVARAHIQGLWPEGA